MKDYYHSGVHCLSEGRSSYTVFPMDSNSIGGVRSSCSLLCAKGANCSAKSCHGNSVVRTTLDFRVQHVVCYVRFHNQLYD